MTHLSIKAGPFEFKAKMEEENAPKTCKAFLKLLPFRNKIVHCRWSGEAVWIPMGDFETGIEFETTPATLPGVTSFCIREDSVKRKSFWPTAVPALPLRWDSWPPTTS